MIFTQENNKGNNFQLNYDVNDDTKIVDMKKEDLDTFFQYHFDESANFMVAFANKNSVNREFFDLKWKKILEDDSIVKKSILWNQKLAGYIVFFERLGRHEVGYWLGREFWGKGIATKSLLQFINQNTTRPMYGCVVTDNIASVNVLAKCGFHIIDTEKAFANARDMEVDEYIMILES